MRKFIKKRYKVVKNKVADNAGNPLAVYHDMEEVLGSYGDKDFK